MLSFLKRVTQLLMLLIFMSVFGVGKVKAQSITPAEDGANSLIINDLIELIETPQGQAEIKFPLIQMRQLISPQFPLK
ncbi:hypothetical protein [Limnofasciculus baicalensis]|uniref:Uncharacterized protein n=1 Tax=Limnofasciculus baicalensis BBK-W-15 TaxID=2699891 RepID=A0AAE3GTL0_9CYAN|nr:hypothetical protein [Limnofasciculus baicalensis]MCP2730490.1 hypothetical protein [Limnofasciculus baicalensis BBK-W-15]